jgi:hypothetical protein
MTHALPGQGGYHHVNCQPPEYWINHMKERGYNLSEDNEIIRQIGSRDQTWNYFSQSGLIFIRE